MSNKKLLYLGTIGPDVVKFGITSDLNKRVYNSHKKEIGDQFKLKHVILTNYNHELESKIKEECKNPESILYSRRISLEFNGKNQTELIRLDSKFTLSDLYNYIMILYKYTDKDFINEILKENDKLKKENEELKKENSD